jgi:hypothetical protein
VRKYRLKKSELIKRSSDRNKGSEKMKEKKDLLAYCGLYCGDCLGYTDVIADAAETMINVLKKYKFDQTVTHIFPEELKDYETCYQLLEFMATLRCPEVCRKKDDTTVSCTVRKCCKNKGFYACYECTDFKTCVNLKSLHKGLHYDSCIQNLRAIKEMGLEFWIIKGKRFMYWDKDH